MSDVQELHGQESAMDMVLDNLGMDGDFEAGGEGEADEGGDGGQEFESNQYEAEDIQERVDRTPQPQAKQQQHGLPRSAEVRADQRGNLIGPDGKIVAKAGFEARMYQETQRARRDLSTEQIRSQDLTSRLNRAIELGQQFHNRIEMLTAQLNDRNTAAAKLGLNDGESIQAMQIAAEAKRDPVSALKKILTMAAAAGVDVTRIGIAPGGVDSQALMGMVQQEIRGAMTPLQQRLQAEQQQREQQEVAQRVYRETESELNTFFLQNPAAREYIPVFHAVLSQPQFQHMSMGEVWARIQLNHMRLTGQQNGANGQSRGVRQNGRAMNTPLPNGRGSPQMSRPSDMAPVNQSYDAILRETLDSLGI